MEWPMEYIDDFNRWYLPLLKDMDSLFSQLTDLDLNNLYVQLKAVERLEECLKRPLRMVTEWSRSPISFLKEHRTLWYNHLETFSSFQKTLDDRRSSIREQINERSRPYLRSLNILDLPDEIVLKICEDLRDELWYNLDFCYGGRRGNRARDIQNLRLSCRKLCATSSHLLLRCLNVDLNDESSVSHLVSLMHEA